MAKKKLTEIEKIIKTTKPQEINHAFQNSVSYSQFSIYEQCPHRWSLENIYDEKILKSSINLIFGTAMHVTLQHYLKVMYEESGAAADKLELQPIFQENFQKTYQEEFDKSKKHFVTVQEMREFYEDGCQILDFISKRRNKLFTIRKVRLLGIELPIVQKLSNNLYLKGYIDFALYDEDLDQVTIYDFKTSTRGWFDKDKKDETKIAQILLYKEYFAKQYHYDIDKIQVEYIILKRKIAEKTEYPQSRVQNFSPPAGKTKRAALTKRFEAFLKECFDSEGKPYRKEYPKNIGTSCKWCPFADKPELCSRSQTLPSLLLEESPLPQLPTA